MMNILIEIFHKVASGVGPFFLLLGLLIFVHELGHYLVAVYFGVRVETFSLGFGKKILKYKRGETTYCLSLIPLGGYVKMYGDDPAQEIPEELKKYSFLHKPVWPRIAIVLAGPLMNLFFAILIFAAIGMLGEEVPGPQLGDVSAQSKAFAAGFRSGDTILKVNNDPVLQWRDIKDKIEDSADQTMAFEVQREGSAAPEKVIAVPEWTKNEFLFSTKRRIGKIEGLTIDSISPMIGVANPTSLSAASGLKSLDIIEAINGETVTYWRQIEPLLKKHASDENWVLKVTPYSENDKSPASHEIKIATSQVQTSPEELASPEFSFVNKLGIDRSDVYLLSVKSGSPADKAGLKSGDRVISLDGTPIESWQQVLAYIKSYKPTQAAIQFRIIQSGEEKTVAVAPEQIELPTEQGAMEKRFAVGVIPAIMTSSNSGYLQKITNPFKATVYGVVQAWDWTKLIAISFLRLIQNEVSARNIGGVITIGRVASKSFELGIVAFLKMMAIISINLFMLNLLPVPVLDGGHLLFFTIEALKGAPLSFKKMEIAQQVGLVLLLSLMIFALFNDISHLISSW